MRGWASCPPRRGDRTLRCADEGVRPEMHGTRRDRSEGQVGATAIGRALGNEGLAPLTPIPWSAAPGATASSSG